MGTSSIFVIVAIVALAVIFIFTFLISPGKRGSKLTPLASIAFVLIIAGIFLSEKGAIGYGIFAVGIVFAAIDIIQKARKKE
jgi:hypothetical protein